MDINRYWDAVARQDATELQEYFDDAAYVNWHCSNEHFTVEEFIRANCEYPGEWRGVVERTEGCGDVTIAVVRVFTPDRSVSCHVVSFMKIRDDKIVSLDEYWGDDGSAPQWRLDKHLGTAIYGDGQ